MIAKNPAQVSVKDGYSIPSLDIGENSVVQKKSNTQNHSQYNRL